MEPLRERLTYANVTASLALFLALTGAGYAAGRIHGSELEARSVAGKKLKRNTVTRREVRESSLRVVPEARLASTARSADRARSAGMAANAQRLDGLDAGQLRITCPSGLAYEAAVCIEPTARPAQTYGAAVATCSVDGRRLPTHNELQALLARGAITVASGGEFTSNVAESRAVAGQLDVVVVTDDTGAAAFVPAGGTTAPRAFRCVEPRSN